MLCHGENAVSPIRQTAACLCVAAKIGHLRYRMAVFMRWSPVTVAPRANGFTRGTAFTGPALAHGVSHNVNKHCMRAQHARGQDTDVLQTGA